MKKLVHWTAIVLFVGAPLAGFLHAEAHWAWSIAVAFVIGAAAQLIVDLCAGTYDPWIAMLRRQQAYAWNAVSAIEEANIHRAADVRRRLNGGDGA